MVMEKGKLNTGYAIFKHVQIDLQYWKVKYLGWGNPGDGEHTYRKLKFTRRNDF